MNQFRNVALTVALAAVAASAWAANGHYRSVLIPSYDAGATTPDAAQPPQPVVPEPVVTPQPAATLDQSLSPGESVVTETRTVRTVTESRITVETPRLTEDERIQAQVMDKLAANSRLSGKIGVVSQGSVVTLSGWTRTAGQAWRAGQD